MRPTHFLPFPVRVLVVVIAMLLFARLGIAEDLKFRLSDVDGNSVELAPSDVDQLTVVCFLGTECPLAKLYASRLNEMSRDFPSVNFIAVGSNQQDSLDDLKAYRDKHQLRFPLAKDYNNVIADQFMAERTPEVFIVDQQLKIRYRGRIDDQYQPGIAKPAPGRADLRIAISECLADKPVSIPRTAPDGCLIGRVKTGENPNSRITYANQISRLIQNHCSECHREGEIGPMELSDYEEVAGWAEMIVEVVTENRMPPWHADPNHGDFINERGMTTAEKQLLIDWLAAGTPLGDLSQLPPPRKHDKSTQWRLPRQPDQIVEMRAKPFSIPAEGTVEYQYFVVDPEFKEDKWIIAAEILPGNRSVLHHSIVFVRPPDGSTFRGIGWLAAYVPGQSAPTINPKFGRRIPAGSKLVFQQHYTPIGKPTSDLTKIGLVFGDEQTIENEVFTILALNQDFVIPPGEKNHPVRAKFDRLPKHGSLMAFSPHMHFRGKSFELTARIADSNATETTPAPSERILLKVPKYDFNWQHIYQLKNPIPIENISSLDFVATFDNSANNPANPDPEEVVIWGDQTWQEMAVAFAIVSQPREVDMPESAEPNPEYEAARNKYREFIDQKATELANDFLARFDADGDGKISLAELPRSTRRFGRYQLDLNHDEVITREEIHENAQFRLVREFPKEKFDPVLSSN